MRPRPLLLAVVPVVATLAPVGAAAIGLEVQAYPAGIITAARHDRALGDRGAIAFLAGWNFTDRRDFGEHDDEHGGGPGLGAATWRWTDPGRTGWGVGIRVDLWWLDIDWEDDGRSGETDVVVLQPTARVGHGWIARDGGMRIEAAVSLGAEINLRTRREKVGEGAILLAGVAVSR